MEMQREMQLGMLCQGQGVACMTLQRALPDLSCAKCHSLLQPWARSNAPIPAPCLLTPLLVALPARLPARLPLLPPRRCNTRTSRPTTPLSS